MDMENILKKLHFFHEENSFSSEELTEATDEFHKQQRLLMEQLGDADLDMYRKTANMAIDRGISDKENFINGMKFGAILVIKLLSV